jgi:hypothetical protein
VRLKRKKTTFAVASMIVRVLTDNGGPKPVGLIARVIEERDREYVILFLSATEDHDHGRTVYRYEDSTYTIDDDYVIEYFDDEFEAGFCETNDGGWVKESSDADYFPSESDQDEEDFSDEEEYIEEEDDQEYIDDD